MVYSVSFCRGLVRIVRRAVVSGLMVVAVGTLTAPIADAQVEQIYMRPPEAIADVRGIPSKPWPKVTPLCRL